MSDASAARTEAWIDAAGHADGDVDEMVASVIAAGIPSHAVRVVSTEDDPPVRADGVRVIPADVEVLNREWRASGAEFLMLVRRGRAEPETVDRVTGFLDRFPEVEVAYGDSVAAKDSSPLTRPRFSPIRLRSNDYLGPIVVVRRSVLERLGGFRPEARRAQVLDLVLRADEAGLDIALVPAVLAREDLADVDFASSAEAQDRVVRDHLDRCGVVAEMEHVRPFTRRLRYRIEGDPLVSIVIPTRGGSAHVAGAERVLVVEAIRGIVDRSTYRNLEFVVVCDRETPDDVVAELRELCGDRLRIVLWDAPFNFSAKMNRGAAAASGEYLLLLNDDVEVVTDDWIESMLGLARQRGVGMVGAMLYFEDSTIQHAGQIYTGGVAGHAAFGWTGGRDDLLGTLATDHEVSGVTAACALIASDVYAEVGGFTLSLPGNYNDVDLNMKVRGTGRSVVFTPWARLYHFESKSRDPRILPSDIETLQSRWLRRMQVEMYSRML
ncbi:hypothetical protein ARHIZOSPH14_03440 [Agromyces rhizosphaerae]|uniref:Glycosyltransferase 2-like domain-containing protein n=1 Tax=Agromyces rhizosphaerae TaxID=88374 RepID=A0A9W6FQ13_9MICO|nr:glycosyltransferase [Agromyces rhizosphaerae]GLI26102.1 hypothetical protein ARHIZOSPH14_03440 [Agromyces rhizosphaerae]